ncbi:MAG TPA: cystathionine beta-lyase, partial [Firmicutes bacterium]|nr:cystathionine beta-lyase [Bacillota bacterium]
MVPTISSSVRKLTSPGDEVVLLTPVYNIFYNSIRNNLRFAKEVPLRYFANSYSIDFPLLEEALSSEKAKLLILCN